MTTQGRTSATYRVHITRISTPRQLVAACALLPTSVGIDEAAFAPAAAEFREGLRRAAATCLLVLEGASGETAADLRRRADLIGAQCIELADLRPSWEVATLLPHGYPAVNSAAALVAAAADGGYGYARFTGDAAALPAPLLVEVMRTLRVTMPWSPRVAATWDAAGVPAPFAWSCSLTDAADALRAMQAMPRAHGRCAGGDRAQ